MLEFITKSGKHLLIDPKLIFSTVYDEQTDILILLDYAGQRLPLGSLTNFGVENWNILRDVIMDKEKLAKGQKLGVVNNMILDLANLSPTLKEKEI